MFAELFFCFLLFCSLTVACRQVFCFRGECSSTNAKHLMLPLALTTSGVLLLSSLSLQTLALHQHQRSHHALITAQRADEHHSLRADWLQRVRGAQRCLLSLPSAAWSDTTLCPNANPALLMAGRLGDRSWQLIHWTPNADGAAELQIRWRDGQDDQIALELPQ